MAPLKRKRPPESTAITGAPPPQRRATRQTSIAPLPVLPDPEPRRRRGRGNPNGQVPSETTSSRVPNGKENIPMQLQPEQQQLSKLTRLTRHRVDVANQSLPTAHTTSSSVNGNTRSTPTSVPTAPMTIVAASVRPVTKTPGPMVGAGAGQSRKHGRSDPEPMVQSHTVGHTKPITMATSTTRPQPAPIPTTSTTMPGQTERGAGQQPERNIDKVVLGDICFRAWYASCYAKELLGDFSSNGTKGENGAVGSADETTGGKTQARRDRDTHQPILDRLYVCPCCFKYSKELVAWHEHVQMCERQAFVPGTKIYVHPKGRRTVLVPSGPAPKPMRGKRGSAGPKMVERVVQDEGEWSIWEVDGAKDVVSLFYRFRY